MNAAEAIRLGFTVKPKEVVPSKPNLAPSAPVQITVENTGLVEALAALEPKVVEITQDAGVTQAFMEALEQSHRAVIHAANKIPARQIVDSCDLTHEYDERSRMPVITSITFKYREAT